MKLLRILSMAYPPKFKAPMCFSAISNTLSALRQMLVVEGKVTTSLNEISNFAIDYFMYKIIKLRDYINNKQNITPIELIKWLIPRTSSELISKHID